MKKLTLILLTLLCVSALNSMEKESEYWNLLPREVQGIIMQFLNSGDALETIQNIKSLSLVNKQLNAVLNDIHQFTALMHVLQSKKLTLKLTSDSKYILNSGIDIAKEFNTPTAKQYMQLYEVLINAMNNNNIEGFKAALKQGADPNAESPLLSKYFQQVDIQHDMLKKSIQPSYAMVQLILKHIANPHTQAKWELRTLNNNFKNAPEYEQIKTLLENKIKEIQSTIAK